MSAVTSGSSSTSSYFETMVSSKGIKFLSINSKYLQAIERMAKDLLGQNCHIDKDESTSKVIASYKTGESQEKIDRSKVIKEMKKQLDELYKHGENEKSEQTSSSDSKTNAEKIFKGD